MRIKGIRSGGGRLRLKSIPHHSFKHGVKSQQMGKNDKRSELLASESFIQHWALHPDGSWKSSDPNMTDHLQSHRLPLFQTQDFSLLLLPRRSPEKRTDQSLRTNTPWLDNGERGLHRASVTPTFWVKAQEKLKNHIISGLETDHHVSTNIFQVTMC